MYRVHVSAPCHPTETSEKVRTAIRNLFPDAVLTTGATVSGTAKSLDRLAELLRSQRIRAAAREVLRGAIRGNRILFTLNKQAAFAGKVSFSADSPLGDIEVAIEAEDASEVVNRLAGPPRTPRQS